MYVAEASATPRRLIASKVTGVASRNCTLPHVGYSTLKRSEYLLQGWV
jgi:hypothetical protein